MAKHEAEFGITLTKYAALPDDDAWRDEVSRGQLVREPLPGAPHGSVQAVIVHRLMQYLEEHPGCGRAYVDVGFVLQQNPLTLRGPDVAFVAALREQEYAGSWLRGAPELAIEVVSPSNRAAEMMTKVAEYLDAGAVNVWVIDPERRVAVVHDATGVPLVLHEQDALACEELLPGFRLELADLFTANL